MNQYIKKIKTDPVGYFFSFCRWRKYNLNRLYYSFLMYILLFLKKVKIGSKSNFYGKAYFNRHPESSIEIGNCCTFDSSKFRNLIGVNKCCIITTLSKEAKLKIGNTSKFSGVKIACANSVTIGDNCLFGANINVFDTDWHAIDPTKRSDPNSIETRPVKIGNNVFIGLNTIILKGSTIGDNSVIGSGSVVSGNIPANVIAAGNPCKIIRNL